jgi:predicted HicB family RNase H-like nuclease
MGDEAAVYERKTNGQAELYKQFSIRLPLAWHRALMQYALDHDTKVNTVIVEVLVRNFLQENHLLK